MQLTNASSPLRLRLALASGILLGAGAAAQAEDGIDIESGLLFYSEGKGRVQVIEPVVEIIVPLSEADRLDLKLTYDSLTGGTPNGALPAKSAQTFSTVSGGSHNYKAAAGALPLDPNFIKHRESADLAWIHDFGPVGRFTLGGGYSDERDFKSVTAQGIVARDFFDKNTTLSFGINGESDRVLPVGGTPVPLSGYTAAQTEGDQRRTELDLLAGVTQIVNRRWIMQFNYSRGREFGYLDDPYKIVSEVSRFICTGSGLFGFGCSNRYVFENRPDQRQRNGLYWENRYAFDSDSVAISYRYSFDDWGIDSHTIDFRYRATVGEQFYIEPHARFYRQSAADFFRYYVELYQPLPDHVSADERLGRFDTFTVGPKLGWRLDDGMELGLRAERYVRRAVGLKGAEVPNALQGLNIDPMVRAWIAQLGVSKAF